MSKLIVEAITEYYGERCPDYDEDCFCCKVWSEYDALTSPARCDELKTAARVSTVFMGIETFAGDFIRGRLKSGDILVTRQNAEEVIAAERMKLEATARVGLQLSEKIEALEADNAALTARIAELEEHFAEMTRSCLAERDRNKALESDNKRLREALKDLIERFSYYAALARDGVPNIEDWAYTEGSSDIAKARAALGEVKP